MMNQKESWRSLKKKKAGKGREIVRYQVMLRIMSTYCNHLRSQRQLINKLFISPHILEDAATTIIRIISQMVRTYKPSKD